jgi:hypothetical protein
VSLKDWLTASWKILTRPTPGNFRKITREREGILGEALAWTAGIVGAAFLVLGLIGYWEGFWLNQLVLGIVLAPLWLLFFVYLQHYLIHKLFRRGRSDYERLLLANALNFGLQLVLSILAYFLGGLSGLANALLLVYYLVLAVLALVGISEVKYWQALLVAAFSGALSLGGLLLAAMVIFSLIWTMPEMF